MVSLNSCYPQAPMNRTLPETNMAPAPEKLKDEFSQGLMPGANC